MPTAYAAHTLLDTYIQKYISYVLENLILIKEMKANHSLEQG